VIQAPVLPVQPAARAIPPATTPPATTPPATTPPGAVPRPSRPIKEAKPIPPQAAFDFEPPGQAVLAHDTSWAKAASADQAVLPAAQAVAPAETLAPWEDEPAVSAFDPSRWT